MTTSNSTLASLWDDGQSSPIRTVGTPTKSLDLNEEMVQFCKESGLSSLAKESGVIDGETSLPAKAIQMVAIPVSGTPIKVEPAQILTKSGGPTGSPMLISTPQRVMSASQLMQSPARTPNIVAASVNMESPTWGTGHSGRKRQTEYLDHASLYLETSDSKRSKKQEKGGKGLRHFSMKVCEKVQKKGVTSYNEVADELVAEFSDPRNLSPTDQQYDQKNIRRRVYDALNVLMAMNIISKEKKEIRWIGLPTNSAQECQNLEFEKKKKLDRIKQKTQQLQELILQQIAFKNLVQRNKQIQTTQGPPQANSAIQLPFIIVNTSKKTVIDCSISNDKYEYLFNFDNTFEIHDDIEVLKRMRMAYGLEKGQCGIEDVKKAAKLVPKALEHYVYDLANVRAPSLSITAGPSGLQAGDTSLSHAQSRVKGAAQSLLSATALPSHITQEQTDMEVAMATHGLSRQSSIGSFSDAGPSNMDSPADAFSEPSDSERSSPVDMM